MPTPKIDVMCVEFIKRIPDQLQTDFTIGTEALPDGFNLSALTIVDFINRGMINLFNIKWQLVEGDREKFISLMPELVGISEQVTSPEYTIESPYKDFHKLIGALKADGTYIKLRSETEYTLFKSAKYKRYQPSEEDPVIIYIQNKLAVFPDTINDGILFHYIKKPVDPETGLAFVQNGDNDSPFSEDWHKEIIDVAYALFLAETKQTD